MIAHVGGVPVEELLGPLVLGATAFVVGARVFISRRLGLRRPSAVMHVKPACIDSREESVMNTPPIVSPRGVGGGASAAAREGEAADARP